MYDHALRLLLVAMLAVSGISSAPLAYAQEIMTETPSPGHPHYSPTDEAMHLARFAALMESFKTSVGLDSYDPLVAVPGQPDDGLPVAPVNGRTISADALATAQGGLSLTTSKDYSHDAKAPDVYVVLSKGTKVAAGSSLYLGKVKSPKGSQAFVIPADARTAGYDTVVLWCKKFSLLVGSAPLNAAALAKLSGGATHDAAHDATHDATIEAAARR